MRSLALLALLATPAHADTTLATSHITAVTIYPYGAQVTRQIEITAPAGNHDILITDLPAAIDPSLIRLSSTDATIGTFALRTDRLPPRATPETPAQTAAKSAVKQAEAALRSAEAKIASINAEVEAQQAQITFLTGIKLDGAGSTADSLSAISTMIGTEVLTARLAALAAQGGLPAANDAVTKAQETLTKAQAALDALATADADYAALSVTLTTSGPAHLTLTHFVEDAAWAPVYDMTLDRLVPRLTIDRGVLVSQASGEDWSGVDLTLSTARPSDQSEPSTLYPDLKSIGDPAPPVALDSMAEGGMAEPTMAPAAMVSESRGVSATLAYQGDAVIYHYPTPVDLANGVENLRLALDQLTMTPKIAAYAVPRADQTAFIVASLTSDAREILLPGTAYLHRDGALTGSTQIGALAPGGKLDLGFGAIDGIKLTRDMPERAMGDRGVFTTSTQLEEKATLKVENLTGDAWPIHLIDQIPYSEQEDLQVTYTADPAPTTENLDGQRGILAWDFDLAAGAAKEVTLNSVLSWPQGKELQ